MASKGHPYTLTGTGLLQRSMVIGERRIHEAQHWAYTTAREYITLKLYRSKATSVLSYGSNNHGSLQQASIRPDYKRLK